MVVEQTPRRQHPRINIVSILCLFATQALFAHGACASEKLVKALQLRQDHVYLGKIRVLLTPQAVRLDGLGKFRFTAISRSPQWQVTVFRKDDRISFTQTLDQFSDQGLFSNMVLPQRENTMPQGGLVSMQKVSGFAVQQISVPYRMLKYLKDTSYSAPQATTFLHAALKVPTDGHIPIAYEMIRTGKDWMTNLSVEGQARDILETDKISLEHVPSTEFEVPSGFARVKSMTRVVIGDSRKMEKTGVDELFKW